MKKQLNSLNARLSGLRTVKGFDRHSNNAEEEVDQAPKCETPCHQVRMFCVCPYHIRYVCPLVSRKTSGSTMDAQGSYSANTD